MKAHEERIQANEEHPRPLKRLRRKYQDGQSPSSPAAPTPSAPMMPLLVPKDEPCELPGGQVESHQPVAEKTSVDTQLHAKNKGKQPILSKEKSSPNAAKEANVEPSLVLKKKSVAKQPLLIPKDEPVTDDMPNLAVPLAVIHPGMLSRFALNSDIVSRCCII